MKNRMNHKKRKSHRGANRYLFIFICTFVKTLKPGDKDDPYSAIVPYVMSCDYRAAYVSPAKSFGFFQTSIDMAIS